MPLATLTVLSTARYEVPGGVVRPYPVIVGSTAGRYFHFPFWLQLWIKITSSRSPVDLRPPTESLDRELSESEEFRGWFMKRKKSYCTPSVVTNFPESRKSPNEYEPLQTRNRAIMG